MNPSQILKMIAFIKGEPKSLLVVESTKHAEPLAQVLFESANLYSILNSSNDLDKIVEQISKKNAAAKAYSKATGKTWLF